MTDGILYCDLIVAGDWDEILARLVDDWYADVSLPLRVTHWLQVAGCVARHQPQQLDRFIAKAETVVRAEPLASGRDLLMGTNRRVGNPVRGLAALVDKMATMTARLDGLPADQAWTPEALERLGAARRGAMALDLAVVRVLENCGILNKDTHE
jgi:hypothetical protein